MKFYFLIFICLILNLQGCKVDPLSLSKTFATSTTAVNISTITRDGVGYYLYVYDASDLTSYVKYSITNISEIPSSLIGGVTIPAYKKITIKTNPSMSSTTLTLPDIRDYFPPLGTGVGYYLYIYDASDLTKYVKYSITGISNVSPATTPASKKITVKPNLTAVSGGFTINLPDSTKPDEPRKVLVTIMADATEIETRMTTLEKTSTVLIKSIVTEDTQTAFNALTAGLVYLDMRTTNVITTTDYTAARTLGCSFTVTGTTNKTPVFLTSYASLPKYINVKNSLDSSIYVTWSKSVTGNTWYIDNDNSPMSMRYPWTAIFSVDANGSVHSSNPTMFATASIASYRGNTGNGFDGGLGPGLQINATTQLNSSQTYMSKYFRYGTRRIITATDLRWENQSFLSRMAPNAINGNSLRIGTGFRITINFAYGYKSTPTDYFIDPHYIDSNDSKKYSVGGLFVGLYPSANAFSINNSTTATAFDGPTNTAINVISNYKSLSNVYGFIGVGFEAASSKDNYSKTINFYGVPQPSSKPNVRQAITYSSTSYSTGFSSALDESKYYSLTIINEPNTKNINLKLHELKSNITSEITYTNQPGYSFEGINHPENVNDLSTINNNNYTLYIGRNVLNSNSTSVTNGLIKIGTTVARVTPGIETTPAIYLDWNQLKLETL